MKTAANIASNCDFFFSKTVFNTFGSAKGVIFPCLPRLGPRFESRRGHYLDWVFSPYLTAWDFMEKLSLSRGFRSTCID